MSDKPFRSLLQLVETTSVLTREFDLISEEMEVARANLRMLSVALDKDTELTPAEPANPHEGSW